MHYNNSRSSQQQQPSYALRSVGGPTVPVNVDESGLDAGQPMPAFDFSFLSGLYKSMMDLKMMQMQYKMIDKVVSSMMDGI